MRIRNLINELIAAPELMLHDPSGTRIPTSQIRREYSSIRAYVIKHVSRTGVVAISLDYGYLYVLSILACMDAGITFLPVRPTWPLARIKQVQDVSKFALMIDRPNIAEILNYSGSDPGEVASLEPESPLYVMFTSGSTGIPKGVVIRRRSYENLLAWTDSCFSHYESKNRILMNVDFTFDASLFDIGLLLLRRSPVFFSRFEGNFFKLADEIERFGITSMTTVPNNANMLLSEEVFKRANLSTLSYLFLGGSRFSYSAYRNIREKLGSRTTCLNLYGPTEATVYSHFKRLSWDEQKDAFDSNISIGTPIPGVTCAILDSRSGSAIDAPHVSGELLLGGIQILKEYIANPARTGEALIQLDGETFYRTGDIGFRDEKGDYYVTGRTDETLKRRGYRVNLLDIDAYIQQLPGVHDSVTVAIPDPRYEAILISYVITSRPVSNADLRAEMSKILVAYQMPDYIEFTDRYPTNNAGKVCRRTLEDRAKVSYLIV